MRGESVRSPHLPLSSFRFTFEENAMRPANMRWQYLLLVLAGCGVLLYLARPSHTQQPSGGTAKGGGDKTTHDQTSPGNTGQQSFAAMMANDKANKDKVMARQKALLEKRYDLSVKVDDSVKMTRGKPIPVGPTARLAEGMTWEELGKKTPEEI